MLRQTTPWRPAAGPLATQWAEGIAPERVHQEHPRPQMVREGWSSLNGLWDYAVRARYDGAPERWDGQILVPFPIESALSGVMRGVTPEERLWYRRAFTWEPKNPSGRLLLHFGAVDWKAEVVVDGQAVGAHEGGYAPFTFDVSDALGEGCEHELVVAVWDPTDAHHQPRGKQVREPHGIWYTAVSGIWQTVWLEDVPPAHIASLRITPLFDERVVSVAVQVAGAPEGASVALSASFPGSPHIERVTALHDVASDSYVGRLRAELEWTPETPHLYDLDVELLEGGVPVDRVSSYFGQRKIEVRRDGRGLARIFLNDRPTFLYGPLDQGWWPDGLYTAPSDAALAFDIETMKALGMNTCRKHVKVEPARWYHHCDRLGLLVWQDMPSGDAEIADGALDLVRNEASERAYRSEWQEIMDLTHNAPSVVAYVPFNEGWGQFKTNEILAWTNAHDPTRLVDGPSGWVDRGGGDLHDRHAYPGPAMFPAGDERASVLGEFGGIGVGICGHLWQQARNWGYETLTAEVEFYERYAALVQKLLPLIDEGLAAAVYTQLTDVEGEVNGLLTYDRRHLKVDVSSVTALHALLHEAFAAAASEPIAEVADDGEMIGRGAGDQSAG